MLKGIRERKESNYFIFVLLNVLPIIKITPLYFSSRAVITLSEIN